MQVFELIKALEEIDDKEQKILVLNGSVSTVVGTHMPEEVCGLKNKDFEMELTVTEEMYCCDKESIEKEVLCDESIDINELIKQLKNYKNELYVHVPHSVISHVVEEVIDENEEPIPNAIGIVSLLHCL